VAQFAAQQNLTAQLRNAITSHRDSWVTENDFAFMASIGVNSVRVPIGYWVLAETQVRVSLSVCPAEHIAPAFFLLCSSQMHGKPCLLSLLQRR
jgi:hypothetical protein